MKIKYLYKYKKCLFSCLLLFSLVESSSAEDNGLPHITQQVFSNWSGHLVCNGEAKRAKIWFGFDDSKSNADYRTLKASMEYDFDENRSTNANTIYSMKLDYDIRAGTFAYQKGSLKASRYLKVSNPSPWVGISGYIMENRNVLAGKVMHEGCSNFIFKREGKPSELGFSDSEFAALTMEDNFFTKKVYNRVYNKSADMRQIQSTNSTDSITENVIEKCYMIRKILTSGRVSDTKSCGTSAKEASQKHLKSGERIIDIRLLNSKKSISHDLSQNYNIASNNRTQTASKKVEKKKESIAQSILPYESSTPTLDVITITALGLLANGFINGTQPSNNYSYDNYTTDITQNPSNAIETSTSSGDKSNVSTKGKYTWLEHIPYRNGQKVVARGKCGNGRKFNVEYYPNNGDSSKYYIISTSGSSKDNVAGRYCT